MTAHAESSGLRASQVTLVFGARWAGFLPCGYLRATAFRCRYRTSVYRPRSGLAFPLPSIKVDIESLFVASIGVYIAVAAAETILSRKWNRTYFRLGIPVLELVLPGARRDPPKSGEAIEAALPPSSFVPLKVHKIEPNVFAIQEASWSGLNKKSYTAMMRGRLEYRSDGSISITGLLTWSALVLNALWLGFMFLAASHGAWLMALVLTSALFGLETWIYLTQRRRFEEAARVASAAHA